MDTEFLSAEAYLIAWHSDWSNRAISQKYGIGQMTVGKIKKYPPQEKFLSRDVTISKTVEEKIRETIIDDFKIDLATMWSKLQPRERRVIKQRYIEDATFSEVAINFGVSPERIRQIEARALRKLRQAFLRK
jgi:DNA-directed RNA polymerase specialized sigma subunit